MSVTADLPAPDSGPEPEVLVHTEGRAGFLTLNRPRAINALTHAMVRRIDEALTAWEHDPAVETVVIRGAGERGLCAGGDIRAIHDDARAGGTATPDFWRDEYRLNAKIARYPKPYVAFMDGIVMGGGVGVSGHGSVRIVTERSRIAMPETGIGFVPDVGGTYLLSRAPGELGTHLALTGAQADAADLPAPPRPAGSPSAGPGSTTATRGPTGPTPSKPSSGGSPTPASPRPRRPRPSSSPARPPP